MMTLIAWFNQSGEIFIPFALKMLVQSSILITIIFVFEVLLRKWVRAVVRYMIWLLVLVKLVLPVSLALPIGIGNVVAIPEVTAFSHSALPEVHADTASEITALSILNGSERLGLAEPAVVGADHSLHLTVSELNVPASIELPPQTLMSASEVATEHIVTDQAAIAPVAVMLGLTLQGGLFLVWLVGVLVMVLLLCQRIWFVRALLRQSTVADGRFDSILTTCMQKLGITYKVKCRLLPNNTSPAVCGLFSPVVLFPQSIVQD